MSRQSLPNELYSRIFNHLSIRDWKTISLICKCLNDLLSCLIFNGQVKINNHRNIRYRCSDVKIVRNIDSLNNINDIRRLTLNINEVYNIIRVPNNIDLFRYNNFDNLISLIIECKTAYNNEFNFFSRLIQLEELTLFNIHKATDLGFDNLKYLINLKSLSIISCRSINNNDLIVINQLTNLKRLNLENSLHSMQLDLDNIHSLINLEYLNLSKSHFAFTWRSLSKFIKLKSLNLLECKFFNVLQGAEAIKELINLEELSIELNYIIREQSMYNLKSLKQLKRLKIDPYYWYQVEESFVDFLRMFNIERLDSKLLILSDDSLNRIKSKTNLKYLDVDFKSITDIGLKHLSQLHNLRRLKFIRCNHMTDHGLNFLTKLTNLKHLEIIDCKKITNYGMLILKHFNRLETINLGIDEGINKSTLIQLIELNELKEMNIYKSRNTFVSDGMFHFKYLNQKRELNNKKQVNGKYIFHF